MIADGVGEIVEGDVAGLDLLAAPGAGLVVGHGVSSLQSHLVSQHVGHGSGSGWASWSRHWAWIHSPSLVGAMRSLMWIREPRVGLKLEG